MFCNGKTASRGRKISERRRRNICDHIQPIMKNIVVLYHKNCLDGLGGAYAAWKKFGDSAEYIPVYHGGPVPELTDKEVYIIDFSFPGDVLPNLEAQNKKLVVLDHHEGAETLVQKVKEHVYDSNRSGTGIAWEYFHGQQPLPRTLAYIQDGDLWRHALPHAREFSAYLGTLKFEFDALDALVAQAETKEGFENIITKGKAFSEYRDYVCDNLVAQAVEVSFEGYTILTANAPRLFRSELGHILAKKKGPFAIVWYPNNGMWHFSMRGDGTIDLTNIAQKHGGNGHPNAASFTLPMSEPFPFTSVKKA